MGVFGLTEMDFLPVGGLFGEKKVPEKAARVAARKLEKGGKRV
jgi:hypothetical protein